MWNWLQKLWSALTAKQLEEPAKKKIPVTTVSSRTAKVRSKHIFPRNRMQDETLSEVPRPPQEQITRTLSEHRSDSLPTARRNRGHFRFPVIPDTPEEKRDKPSSTESRPLENRSERKKYHSSTERENKPPFKPTELPAPLIDRILANRAETKKEEPTPLSVGSHQEQAAMPTVSSLDIEDTQAGDTRQGNIDTNIKPSTTTGLEKANTIDITEWRAKEARASITADDWKEANALETETSAPEAGENAPEKGVHLSKAEAELPVAQDQVSAAASDGFSDTLEATETEGEWSSGNEQFDAEVDLTGNPSVAQTEPAAEMRLVGATDQREEELAPADPLLKVASVPQEANRVTVNERPALPTNTISDSAQTSALSSVQSGERSSVPTNERGKIQTSNFHMVTDAVNTNQPGQFSAQVQDDNRENPSDYQRPPITLLDAPAPVDTDDDSSTEEQRLLLEETLANFNVQANVVGIVKGPSVTRFELQPAPGVKVNKITGLADDIKLSLAAKDIRIEAPIPGRNAVGVEVPNRVSRPVLIREIIQSPQFLEHPSPLAVALGMDIGGEPIIADIKRMPHGLIAGATGSGKSVCINSIIVSLLFKATPEQVRLLLIDPKMVELAPYNHLPHLITPVVTEPKQATAALKWAVEEMERRYTLFVEAGARDIERYNLGADEPLPYVVIVIDELADLMMVSPQDVEDSIIRIAQKARASGIHLLLATQRPSVDVITGNIKANVPTRLAFAVFSQVDSRTILDQSGAERLLGRGDMLFLESGAAPIRLQGNFVSDDEIERITQMIKAQRKPQYMFQKEDLEQSAQAYEMGDDPLYLEALQYVAEQGQASASALQRRFRVGYNRAARLIEMMEAEGYIAGLTGGKPRAVLITQEEAKALVEGNG